jgi:hypothetical protein
MQLLNGPNKLDCLFQPSLMCFGLRPGANPRDEHLKDASILQTPVFLTNIRLGFKMPDNDKHSSLLGKFIKYEENEVL